jgi:succinate dehydrogenase / fumarate reductase membrane anchor subunit
MDYLMNHVVSKWLMQRVAAVLLIPVLLWFLFHFDNLMNFSYLEALQFLNNRFNVAVISLIFILAFFHMRLGMSEIFEDYIQDEKIRKLANLSILGISIIIPVAAITAMIILAL